MALVISRLAPPPPPFLVPEVAHHRVIEINRAVDLKSPLKSAPSYTFNFAAADFDSIKTKGYRLFFHTSRQ